MKLKLIAAAVALVASSSSFAFIVGPQNGPGNPDADLGQGPPELFLTVWQQAGTGTGSVNRSFTFDLGVTVADMQANQGVDLFINQTVSGSAEWASFLAAGSSTAFQYSVVGGDESSSALTNVLLQTYAGSSIAQKTNQVLGNALDNVAAYAGANNATGTHGSTLNGVSFNQSGTEYYMDSNAPGNTWGSTTGLNSAAVGTSMIFGQMLQNGTAAGNLVTNSIFAGKMLLAQQGSDYVLQYQVAAVPEPTGYALALAGFGIVGFVARRRKSA